ncbi:MAG: beta-N-acetylhexosaminidase [Alphaproteobacteria bacterium]|nr:beta-N-acetylhexosaminidase [Alphaproteobacteria bacterium]
MANYNPTIFGCAGLELSAGEKDFFREAAPWGFILFARNISSPDQIRALTADLRATTGRNTPILIDQEGGRVARLQAPNWLQWLPPLEQMNRVAPQHATRSMWIRYRLIADELRALGIDANCAPMLDIPTSQVHAIIRNRCYGESVEVVVEAGHAVAGGLLAGGGLPVLKHIPGHGRPNADSHAERPRTDASKSVLTQTDFAPFRALNHLPLGMSAHVVYSSIDPVNCATQSKPMIEVIRSEIGFDGALMTDDLSMSALEGTLAVRTRRALDAGCDVILHCNGNIAEMAEVTSATHAPSAKTTKRLERALSFRAPPEPMERDQLLAELSKLL